MIISDWKKLDPSAAAAEIHRRVQRLSPEQRRAVIASLPPEAELASRFASAPKGRALSGVPFFVKDLFDVAGEPTRAGSSFLAEVRPVPSKDSAIVRAFKEAGAVLAGKTHLHEFAYGLTGDNAFYGDCDNPRFPGRTTGGSSSGSAAVVAADIAPLAIGSDTGGSVRVPAAYCGVYGFRMRPKEPWVADAFPLAPRFDTAGWFTETAEDMKISLEALCGTGVRAAKIPRGLYVELPGLDPDVAAALRKAASELAAPADATTAAALTSGFAPSSETYVVLQSLEAFELHRPWIDKFRDRYSPEVWSRIDRGRHWTPAQIDAAKSGFQSVNLVWDEYFKNHDFLILPCTFSAALIRGAYPPDYRQRLIALTTPASVGGKAVLTIPVALPSGLTSGLQVVFEDIQTANWVLSRRAPNG